MGRGLAAFRAACCCCCIRWPTAAQAPDRACCPWPNDTLTKRDKTTDTGRRLNLPTAGMPRNKDGVPIDPTDMNRADGFSPGSMIIVKVPGLDNAAALQRSHLPSLRNLAAASIGTPPSSCSTRARASAIRSGLSWTPTRPPTPTGC